MILTKEDIGKVFRLKHNKSHWCIPIQENIIFSDTNPKIVETNIFGPITKPCEIEFVPNDIDEKEIYENIEKFNEIKNCDYYKWQYGSIIKSD